MEKYYAYGVDKLLHGYGRFIGELASLHSSQKEFYGKAGVWLTDKGVLCLRSYTTLVAVVLPNGRYLSGGNYSATTSRHQKEFFKQFAKSGSLDDYVSYDLEQFWY